MPLLNTDVQRHAHLAAEWASAARIRHIVLCASVVLARRSPQARRRTGSRL